MTNLTKAIAVLGVVAGLGVAALPLSSYAADNTVTWGEGTEGTNYGTDGAQKWVKTDVGVMLKIDDQLTISADKDTTEANLVDLSGEGHTGAVNITVVTNNQSGYNLNLKGMTAEGTANALVSENKDEIDAAAGTFTAPSALSTSKSEWGYSVANTNENLKTTLTQFTDGVYAGVSAGGQEIVNVDKPTGTDGDKTTITFAASVADGQPAGTYKGQVTFTATNNVIVTE